MERKDWLVTAYNKDDKATFSTIIKDRTEQEAESEALSKREVREAFDWTMVGAEVAAEDFVDEWGISHKEAVNLNGLSDDDESAGSEALIGFNYFWVVKANKWIDRDCSFFDVRDNVLLNYIENKK